MTNLNQIVRNALAAAKNDNGGPYGVKDRVIRYLGTTYSLRDMDDLARGGLKDRRWQHQHNRISHDIKDGRYTPDEVLKIYRHRKSKGTAYEEKNRADAKKILDINWTPEARRLAEKYVPMLLEKHDIAIKDFKEDLEFMRNELKKMGFSV